MRNPYIAIQVEIVGYPGVRTVVMHRKWVDRAWWARFRKANRATLEARWK